MREMERGQSRPCGCVFRSIFRICFSKFVQCVTKEKHLTQVTLEYSARGGRRITWSRKNEEFIADFLLVARRSLDPAEYKVFKFHYLLGADYRLCCRRLKVDRGHFFHTVYRIQEKLGRVFRELKPYALYPVDEYFNGRTENTTPSSEDPVARVIPFRQGSLNRELNVPTKKAA